MPRGENGWPITPEWSLPPRDSEPYEDPEPLSPLIELGEN